MFIICSYMSKSKVGQPGPYQPTVERRAASRRDRPQIGVSRPIFPFCAFLRFLAFLRICLSAAFCNSERFGRIYTSRIELYGATGPK